MSVPAGVPLLSVLIPTANRLRYLAHTVASIRMLLGPDLELVICDTSDTDDVSRWAETIDDTRIRYEHRDPPVSMTDNFNAAVKAASGRFLMCIGDDDGVLPSALDVAAWCEAQGVDAVVPTLPARYLWPDFVSRVWGDRHAAKLYVDPYSGTVAPLDVPSALDEFLRSGGQGTRQLPRAYHAVVRRLCLTQLIDSHGDAFFGVSPDVSGAVALTTTVRRAVSLDFPLSVSGAAGGSNAGRSAAGRHVGDLRDDPHLRPFRSLYWPDIVPPFFSVETTWAQAAVETLERVLPARLADFNVARLHALCLFRHPGYRRVIATSIGAASRRRGTVRHVGGVARELASVAAETAARAARRAIRPTPRGLSVEYGGLQTIADGVSRMAEHMRQAGIVPGQVSE